MKKSLLFVPLLFACKEVVRVSVPGPPPPPPPPTVRIATFNVHRFFDTVCDSGNCGPGDFEDQFTTFQFDAKADQLFEAIDELNADVILLQEIETQTCLDALIARSKGRFSGVFGEIGTAGSVDVAVISRVQMIGFERHRPQLQLSDGRVSIFSRILLEVQLSVAGKKVVVFAAHFRSKVSDDPLRRLAEAQTAAELALERAAELQDALVVVGGDMNDVPGSPPINAIEDRGLLRVASELSPADGTFIFNGSAQAIDHLMLVPGAYDYVPGSALVVEPGGVGYGGSDHSALIATFLLDDPQ